jgi:endonuclease YncB( thermonuclease family)
MDRLSLWFDRRILPGAWACACLLGTLCTALPPRVSAEEITGTVTHVASGDTLFVTEGGNEVEVRLADIGAPQRSEYYSPASRTLLSNIALTKSARVVITDRAGPKRVFGRVFVDPLDVNLELVQRGAAWVCWEYATDTGYLPYENDAIRHQRGLWYQTSQFDARIRCRGRPPALHPVGKQ